MPSHLKTFRHILLRIRSASGACPSSDRFRAAIASGSVANLSSQYGVWTLWEQVLFDDINHNGIRGQLEHGELRMGVAPWQDPQRYAHNSPVLWAGQVRTPLMLIHGDLDQNVPVNQAEEMFTALHRQDKDAVFVRYWGEDHVLASPVHIVDMWNRIFGFLDTHLGGTGMASPRAPALPPVAAAIRTSAP